MRLDNTSQKQIELVCARLQERAGNIGELIIKYIDLGVSVIRLICHSPEFMRHVHRQMECSLRESADHYDATLVIWREPDASEMGHSILAIADESRYRQERILKAQGAPLPPAEQIGMFNGDRVPFWPLLDINPQDGSILAHNPETNFYYYGITNLDPEEFIKRGHIFVHILFRICNTPVSTLSHGAVIGLNNTGVLFCAFGYRGKSTLCVQALCDGFEYVSDDYFILGKKQGESLKAWPIYSIVALAPPAYDQLYNDFDGKFLSMNARKDKYMFNIAAYHAQFKYGYPLKIAMFPNICGCQEPSIEAGWEVLCLEELCFSTLNNTGYQRDALTVGKLYEFTRGLEFFRFNLSLDNKKNTKCLRDFLQTRRH